MSDPRTHLLIPIHVDALVVQGPGRFPFAVAAPQYSLLKTHFLVGADLRKPLDPAKLEDGIHLHFRLPVALAHCGADGQFPRIPNRWLVQRYYTSVSGSLCTTAWIVLSDKASEEADSGRAIVLPVFPGAEEALQLRRTGICQVICDERGRKSNLWNYATDNARAEVEITAVSGADAGFSAHYPACRSILGFHDNLAGVPVSAKVTFTYVVTGWYSGEEDDPWSTLVSPWRSGGKLCNWRSLSELSKKKINAWMAEHRCGKEFKDDLPLPDAILCHGVVRGIVREAGGPAPNPDPFRYFGKPEEYRVDLGNTSAEAFAARVAQAQKPADHDLLEDMMNAFQTGLLSQGGDFPVLDSELHRQGFASVEGGGNWKIEPEAQETSSWGANDTARQTASLPGSSLPGPLQEALDKLNRYERAYERHTRLLKGYEWELNAIWHRYANARKDRASESIQQSLKQNLTALQGFVTGYWSRPSASTAKSERDSAEEKLRGVLNQHNAAPGTPTKYTLPPKPQPLEPFYLPKDPVLLLSGPAMKALGTEPPRDGILPCRVTGEELRSFTYDEQYGNKEVKVAPNALQLGVSAVYLDAIPRWSAALLREALLLDKWREMESSPGGTFGSYLNLKEGSGVLPDDYGIFQWPHNPWIPIYMYWEVSLQFTAHEGKGEFAANTILDQWTLDPPAGTDSTGGESKFRRNTDLFSAVASEPHSTEATPAPKVYSGISFPSISLVGIQANRFQGNAKKLLDQVTEKLQLRLSSMMSLTLAGFHDALIMRRVGDQLPHLDFTRKKNEGHWYLDKTGVVAGSMFQPGSSPATDGPFFPFRAGSLQVKSLRIIDAFGQWLQIPLTRLPPGNSSCSGRLATAFQLRPRFCTPMRLAFSGIPAGNDIVGIPGSSPVCGWVVMNHFDRNLILYATNGRPAGIIQERFATAGEEKLFYWVAIPGSAPSGSTLDGIHNEYLRDFARFVLSLNVVEGEAFAKLLDKAVISVGKRVPAENPAVSFLIGRPLALVRASLRFEAEGLPALHQTESWIKQPEAGQLADGLTWPNKLMVTRNVESVLWPLRLGDSRNASDGLVGYFKGEAGARPFYPGWGFDFGNNVPAENLQPRQELKLDCTEPLRVTLLMDPQACVHATSGVLPRVSFQLDAADLTAARQVREVFFQTAPVLGTHALPDVPKPSDDYGEWSWVYRPCVTGWQDDPNLVSASDRADSGPGWPTLAEGWLKLKIEPVRINSLWMKYPAKKPKRNAPVTIAWSVQGADTVELFRVGGAGQVQKEEFVKKWESPLQPQDKEWQETLGGNVTFEVRASDKAGYKDAKQIAIEVED